MSEASIVKAIYDAAKPYCRIRDAQLAAKITQPEIMPKIGVPEAARQAQMIYFAWNVGKIILDQWPLNLLAGIELNRFVGTVRLRVFTDNPDDRSAQLASIVTTFAEKHYPVPPFTVKRIGSTDTYIFAMYERTYR